MKSPCREKRLRGRQRSTTSVKTAVDERHTETVVGGLTYNVANCSRSEDDLRTHTKVKLRAPSRTLLHRIFAHNVAWSGRQLSTELPDRTVSVTTLSAYSSVASEHSGSLTWQPRTLWRADANKFKVAIVEEEEYRGQHETGVVNLCRLGRLNIAKCQVDNVSYLWGCVAGTATNCKGLANTCPRQVVP